MSAADKREELEARVHQMLTDIRQEGIEDCAMYIGSAQLDVPHLAKHLTGRVERRQGTARAILAGADDYAVAFAEQQVNRMTPDELRARLRLAEATAETRGNASA